MATYKSVIFPVPLPKKFELKLRTEVQATPAEFAEALANEDQRPQWEPKLKSIAKKGTDEF